MGEALMRKCSVSVIPSNVWKVGVLVPLGSGTAFRNLSV
jgi:hypothetical protein